MLCLTCVAGLADIGWRIWKSRTSKSTEEKPMTVRLEKAALGDLTEAVQATGEIEPKTKVSISARVAARIAKLPFKEGDNVTAGNATTSASVLVVLDATDLQAALKSAQARYAGQQAQIKVAEAHIASQKSQIIVNQVQLADARRDLLREQQLRASNNVSLADLEQAQRKVDELTAQLEAATHSLEGEQLGQTVLERNLDAAEAEITRARNELSYATITTPIDGVVTRLNAKAGELVMTGTMNNAGTVILEVADLARMLVVAKLSENDIAYVKAGQKARVRMETYRGRVFDGVVDNIALVQTNDAQRGGPKYFRTEILLNTGGERIYSGISADVDIETSHHTGVVKVPSQAVLGRAYDDIPVKIREATKDLESTRTVVPVVYRVVDNKTVITPVKVGPSDATHTIIESGLTPKDTIVIGPYKILEGLANDKRVQDERETSATKTGAKQTTGTQTAGAQTTASKNKKS